MQNIAFRKTFIIGTLNVMPPGMHIAFLLDLAEKLQVSKILEYCKILL